MIPRHRHQKRRRNLLITKGIERDEKTVKSLINNVTSRSSWPLFLSILLFLHLYLIRSPPWHEEEQIKVPFNLSTFQNRRWSVMTELPINEVSHRIVTKPDSEKSIEKTSLNTDSSSDQDVLVTKGMTVKNVQNARHYHDYAVFIVHYHKTGYVLSRELVNLVYDMELVVQKERQQLRRNKEQQLLRQQTDKKQRQDQIQDQNQTSSKYIFHLDIPSGLKGRNKHGSFEKSGLDQTDPVLRIAFDQFGNWVRSAFQARQHDPTTSCPMGLGLEPGVLYVQESPDLFCPNEMLLDSFVGNGNGSWIRNFRAGGRRGNTKEARIKRHEKQKLLKKMNKDKPGRVKIINFVRNPFEMVLSNYLYHSQYPTPEKWVHEDDPCHELYEDGASLGSHVLMTVVSGLENHSVVLGDTTDALSLDTAHQHLLNITNMCHSLYQSNQSTKNKTFYEHLRYLNEWDGLRLASAQMIASSGVANNHLAGGDVLRMANNVVRFTKLLEEKGDKDVQLLTLSMDDFITNTAENTMKFLDFLFGEDSNDHSVENSAAPIMPRNVRWEASKQEEYKFLKKENDAHVTAKGKSRLEKEELKEKLRRSPELGPILSHIEVLVNQALMAGQ